MNTPQISCSESDNNERENENELDQRIAEAGAKQEEYNEWRRQMAANCLRRGIAFPSSYELLRAWNRHQKEQAIARAAEKKKLARIRQLEERARRAVLELQAISGADHVASPSLQLLVTAKTREIEEEPSDAFFAQIDADIAAIQAGDTGGYNRSAVATATTAMSMEPDRILQKQRAQKILQDEEAALRKNNLGEL